jgi:hypothetical protein
MINEYEYAVYIDWTCELNNPFINSCNKDSLINLAETYRKVGYFSVVVDKYGKVVA